VNTAGGTQSVTLETGTTDRDATYSSGSTTTILSFTYVVQAGDTSSDLQYVTTSSLASNSGTIRDAAGNDAILTLPALASASSLAGSKNIAVCGGCTVTFNAWDNIKALGGRTHYSQTHIPAGQRLSDTNPTVTLRWNEMTGSSAISEYRVFRGTTSGTLSQIGIAAVSTPTISYSDSTVTVGTTYYYRIKAVISGVVIDSTESDAEIKVIVPPTNMALLHRWIANRETCGLMGRSIERNNNYRCAYTGPGSVGFTGASTGTGYYDLEHSYFVDVVELGCAYTTSGCTSGPCIFNAAPVAGDGRVGDFGFNCADGTCY